MRNNRDPYCIANDYNWSDRDAHRRNELKQWPKIGALMIGAGVLLFGIGVMF